MMPPAYLKGPTDVLPTLPTSHWCVGKVRFESAILAAEVAARSQKRGHREHYYCRSCGGFHVGSHNRSNIHVSKAAAADLVRSN
jgi:hypothetical protein